MTGSCAQCHSTFERHTRGRPRVYCDDACRVAAFRKREGRDRTRRAYTRSGLSLRTRFTIRIRVDRRVRGPRRPFDVACPKCGAIPGAWCGYAEWSRRAMSSRWSRRTFHRERWGARIPLHPWTPNSSLTVVSLSQPSLVLGSTLVQSRTGVHPPPSLPSIGRDGTKSRWMKGSGVSTGMLTGYTEWRTGAAVGRPNVGVLQASRVDRRGRPGTSSAAARLRSQLLARRFRPRVDRPSNSPPTAFSTSGTSTCIGR